MNDTPTLTRMVVCCPPGAGLNVNNAPISLSSAKKQKKKNENRWPTSSMRILTRWKLIYVRCSLNCIIACICAIFDWFAEIVAVSFECDTSIGFVCPLVDTTSLSNSKPSPCVALTGSKRRPKRRTTCDLSRIWVKGHRRVRPALLPIVQDVHK